MKGQDVMFERGMHAPDENRNEICYFNEYRSTKWWTAKALRRHLLDRIAPFAIVAGTLAAFAVLGYIEIGGC